MAGARGSAVATEERGPIADETTPGAYGSSARTDLRRRDQRLREATTVRRRRGISVPRLVSASSARSRPSSDRSSSSRSRSCRTRTTPGRARASAAAPTTASASRASPPARLREHRASASRFARRMGPLVRTPPTSDPRVAAYSSPSPRASAHARARARSPSTAAGAARRRDDAAAEHDAQTARARWNAPPRDPSGHAVCWVSTRGAGGGAGRTGRRVPFLFRRAG